MPRGGDLTDRILKRYILPGERIVVATRRHWGKVLEPVATTAAGFVAIGILAGLAERAFDDLLAVLWIGWLLLAARMVWELLQWRNEWFVATDKRLLLVYGLITHKVAMMPLRKVTDMNYLRTPLGRVLGFGTFVLESAGQDQAMHDITWIAHPDATYRKLCDTLFGPDGIDPDDGPAPEDDKSAVLDTDPIDDPWEPPALVPLPPPAAVPPTARRVGHSSGPTLPLPRGAWTARDPVPYPPEDEGWVISDESRAPFVRISPEPPGRHTRES